MNREQFLKNLDRPVGKIDVILDTDAYNEIDDQFAISYMLTYPEKLNVVAINAAPFLNEKSESPGDGMEKSYDEILKLLKLARKEDLTERVYKGSTDYLADEITPQDSPAARNMARLADSYSPERPLYIAAIGAITNVASAFLLNPKMAENCVVVWLGGNAVTSPWEASEFNMMQDIAAARVIFASGVPLVLLPCMGVVDRFATGRWELEHYLVGRGPLCDYLAQNTIREAERISAWKAWTRVIWDVTAVAWLVDEGRLFMLEKTMPRFMPTYDKKYDYSNEGEDFVYVFHVYRDALFDDLFGRLTYYESL
ncbi:MAG: nucleoside hydrolase [Clostridia bacterium]|nr:nucleoside hydrolase [Clostridia bacterium]